MPQPKPQLAALTRTAKLITVVPHRGAVQAAKTIATIDYLSGGRTVLGVGAGWIREEFDALSIPPFDERGRVTDEYLGTYKELWTKDAPEFHGTHVDFANISFSNWVFGSSSFSFFLLGHCHSSGSRFSSQSG